MLGEAFGVYKATVANNRDPQSASRVTLKIPQLLGDAESNWATPSSPSPFVPLPDAVVWVQFSGGDLARPVYTAVGLEDLGAITGPIADGMPPKPPTALTLTTAAVISSQGAVTASVTASWTVPTQNQDNTPLTDLDHYEIETSYDNTAWSAALATTNNQVLFNNVRPGVAYYVRVVSVDHWGNRSTYATSNLTTATSTTPPPQPSTPVVLGVLGAVRVRWDGLDSTATAMPSLFDHVIVQRSVIGDFSDVVNIGLMSAADTVYDSSSSLSYTVAATYRLVPVSRTGVSGTASATATGTPFQALSTDILDHSISTVKIALAGLNADTVLGVGTLNALSGVIGSLDASKITVGTLDAGIVAVINLLATNIVGGTLDANVVNVANLQADSIVGGSINAGLLLSGSIATATSGNRVTIGPAGIVLYDSLGNIEVSLPTDPTQSASFSGNVNANTLTVYNGMSIRGLVNEFAVASSTFLRAGLTAVGAPSVVVDWETGTPAIGGLSWGGVLYGSFYDSAKMYFTQVYPTTTILPGGHPAHDNYLCSVDYSGIQTNQVMRNLANTANLGSYSDTNQHQIGGGLAKIGSSWYFLCSDGVSLQVRIVSATTFQETGNWTYAASLPPHAVTMGTDGTNLLFAGADASGHTFIRVITPAGSNVASYTSTHTVSQDACAVLTGSFDFGSTRFIVGYYDATGTIRTNYSYTLSGSTLTNQTDESWPGAPRAVGVSWDTVNSCFATIDAAKHAIMKYTGIRWTAATSSKWWISFAWHQTAGSYFTTPSSKTSLTMLKRARLTISVPTIPFSTPADPSDPDGFAFYLGRSAPEPINSAMWLQTLPAAGFTFVGCTNPTFSGTNPVTVGTFPAQVPASIVSDVLRTNGNPFQAITGDGKMKTSELQLGDPGLVSTSEVVKWTAKDSTNALVYERRDTLKQLPGAGNQAEIALRRNGTDMAILKMNEYGQLYFDWAGVVRSIVHVADNNSWARPAGGLPWSMSGGSVAITCVANTPTLAAITFPASRFTVAPLMSTMAAVAAPGSPAAGTAVSGTGASSITTSGANIAMTRNAAGASTAHWLAIQMTDTTAAG